VSTRRPRLRRLVQSGIGLALAAVWAVTLRPASLGGPATYIVVRGDSMLPDFHTGDLIILHTAGTYGVGDVVGYRVPEGEVGEGHVVVHRIVAGDGAAGFVMEGDNNPAPDPWLPRSGNIAGTVWLQIPNVGRIVALAHQPVVAGAFAVSVLVMVLVARWLGSGRLGARRSLVPVGQDRRAPRATGAKAAS
jgi:signal peptidase I